MLPLIGHLRQGAASVDRNKEGPEVGGREAAAQTRGIADEDEAQGHGRRG